MLTPLHVATDLSHHDVMDTLLRLGAKVNSLDALGQTGISRRLHLIPLLLLLVVDLFS